MRLRDAVWQFIGVILALLALLVSIWIYIRQKARKVLVWDSRRVIRTKPQNRRIGYARVSHGQTLDAQLEQLRGACCTEIYREKVMGRAQRLRELLKTPAARAPATW